MVRSDRFALSGAECAFALCSLGFVVVRRQPGRTIMRRGAHLVFVPDRLSLPTSVLDRILQEADVPFAALIAAIEELPTEPELHIIEPDR
jgi:hypothetical protein